MRVRLSERQLNLLRETEKKESIYQRFLRHKIVPYVMERVEDYSTENEDIYHYSVVNLIEDIQDEFGMSYDLASFAVFTYLVRDDIDPLEHWYLPDWLYRVDQPMEYLKHSGFYDKYMTDVPFNDIEKTEDGRVIFSVDNWEEFADLFDESDAVRGILGEDWFEMYDYYNYPITDVVSNLSDENVKYVIETIIEKHGGESISGLEHREEFEDLLNENGDLVIDDRLKTITDSYNLGILLSESELLDSDIASDLNRAYNSAYNSAAEGELWKESKDEIEDFLGSKGSWGKDEMLVFDITNTYQNIIDDYVLESHEVPEEFSFISLLYDYVRNYYHAGQLKISDLRYFYPSSEAIERDFNDNIRGYF